MTNHRLLTEPEKARVAELNLRTTAGGQPPELAIPMICDLLSRCTEFISHHRNFRPPQAKTYLQDMGGLTSSLVRHHVSIGNDPQVAIASVSGLDESLSRLGKICGLPPRDTAETTWLFGEGFSFTATIGEREFGRSVRTINQLLGDISEMLRPVADGDYEWLDSRQVLERAEALMSEVRTEYNRFRLKDGGMPFAMTGEEFVFMRDFLGPYDVGAQTLTGPNAAFTPGPMRIDSVLGTADSDFLAYLSLGTKLLSKKSRQLVEADSRGPSVLDAFISETGMSEQKLIATPDTEVAAVLASMPDSDNYINSLASFRKIRTTYATASAAHLQAIKTYLTDLEQKLSPALLDRLVVPFSAGTGGNGHDHTARLVEMRAAGEVETKLVNAAELIGEAAAA